MIFPIPTKITFSKKIDGYIFIRGRSSIIDTHTLGIWRIYLPLYYCHSMSIYVLHGKHYKTSIKYSFFNVFVRHVKNSQWRNERNPRDWESESWQAFRGSTKINIELRIRHPQDTFIPSVPSITCLQMCDTSYHSIPPTSISIIAYIVMIKIKI